MSRRFFHYLCVALLLIAQQGALVHATWHAGQATHAHKADAHGHSGYDGDSGGEAPLGQGSLCAFDLAFGQVLGGVHGTCALLVIADIPAVVANYTFNPRLGSEAVPAHSRDPPIFL